MQMNWFAFFPGLYKAMGADKIGFFVNPSGPNGTTPSSVVRPFGRGLLGQPR